jgi:hypothetical protein
VKEQVVTQKSRFLPRLKGAARIRTKSGCYRFHSGIYSCHIEGPSIVPFRTTPSGTTKVPG